LILAIIFGGDFDFAAIADNGREELSETVQMIVGRRESSESASVRV
jgi:hypothetical protein